MKTMALLNWSDGFKYELGRFLFGLCFLAALLVTLFLCTLIFEWIKSRKK